MCCWEKKNEKKKVKDGRLHLSGQRRKLAAKGNRSAV